MNLDGKQLTIGSKVYHLTLGVGTVQLANADSAMATFNGQSVGFNAAGMVGAITTKQVGLEKPLTVWGEAGEDVSKLVPIVKEALFLMGVQSA
jgi:hypothetical protein